MKTKHRAQSWRKPMASIPMDQVAKMRENSINEKLHWEGFWKTTQSIPPSVKGNSGCFHL